MPTATVTPLPLPTAAWLIPDGALDTLDIVRMAFELANAAAVTDIESEAHPITVDGATWWDTRPMTDPARHSPVLIDLANASLRYALAAQLIGLHPQRPYLVQITNRG